MRHICRAHAEGRELDYPVKAKAKARRIEERTVFLFQDAGKTVIRKRPAKGLLAGLYEFPNREGRLTKKDVIEYSKELGLAPVRVRKIGEAKHIFSHVEWHMTGYEILVDELEQELHPQDESLVFADIRELQEKYAVPSAFEAFMPE